MGEQLHEMETGRMMCDLCVTQLPESKRTSVRTERVHAADRHLTVAPRAA